MLTILKEYIEGGYQISEYSRDGVNVSHTVKVPIQSEMPAEPEQQEPTLEDKINYIYYKNMGVI
ncbi:hypothetical protein [Cytobacillus sp.]|uniref:hypothetical protein n=1 Tax=Cytobacillus sp. TaxID=2675269 RepID=UPI003513B72D